MPVVRRAWSTAATSVVVVLVAGLVAGLAYGAWASRHRTFAATATFQVFPLPNTGDPDRVIATQVDVLQSRTLHDQVAESLTSPASFSVAASQRRLSSVLQVVVTSSRQATATDAAATITDTYPREADTAVPPVVRLTVLDPPLTASLVGDQRRDSVLVALGGAALAVAVLVLLSSLRPRLRRSYDVAPVGAVVLELPHPGRAGSRRRELVAAELRRFTDHVLALSGGERPALRVSALEGVDTATLAWVSDVLRDTSADVPDPVAQHRRRGEDGDRYSLPAVRVGTEVTLADGMMPARLGDERPLSVLVARAGVGTESDLRKEVGSRAAFSEVVVVLLGASRPALVMPASAPSQQGRRVDDGRHRTHRSGQTVWR